MKQALHPKDETVLVKLDRAESVLKVSKATVWRLAKGEWSKAGVARKVGGQWRINWPKFLEYYNLKEE